MNDIVTFLCDRLDEREAIALAAQGTTRGIWKQVDPEREPGRIEDDYGDVVTYDESSPDEAQGRHIALNHPARVLTEVAAKRRVLARHHASNSAYGPWCVGCGEEGQQEMPRTQHINECPELRDLAAAYADHADYAESWRP